MGEGEGGANEGGGSMMPEPLPKERLRRRRCWLSLLPNESMLELSSSSKKVLWLSYPRRNDLFRIWSFIRRLWWRASLYSVFISFGEFPQPQAEPFLNRGTRFEKLLIEVRAKKNNWLQNFSTLIYELLFK